MKMQGFLAALLVLAVHTAGAQDRPAAQAGDTAAPLDIVFIVFPDTAAANNAVSGLSTAQRGHVESYQVVSRDQQGKVTAGKRRDKPGGSTTAQRAGQSLDGMVALLGEQPQRDTSGAGAGKDTSGGGNPSAQGYAPGQASAGGTGVSSTNMTRMQDMLAPGNAAVILVVDDPYGRDLGGSMRQADGAAGGMAIQLVPVPDSAQ
jgi:hypothetical protein